MSNTRCEILPWILVPVAGTALFAYIVPTLELQLMYLLAVIALAAHAHYGTCVVSMVEIDIVLHFFLRAMNHVVYKQM